MVIVKQAKTHQVL